MMMMLLMMRAQTFCSAISCLGQKSAAAPGNPNFLEIQHHNSISTLLSSNSMTRPVSLQSCLRKQCLRVGVTKIPSRHLAGISRPSPELVLPNTKSRFPTKELSYHWETTPPTNEQLARAASFFQTKPVSFLWSSEKFKDMEFDEGDSPEVCFLGRSNVGKSSLLNALLIKKLAYTSARPGRTKLMNAFAVGDPNDKKNRLVILDMPGYGKGGRAEWGLQIMKYLEKRRQLKRAFLLVNSNHGLKSSDLQMIGMFQELRVPFQIVLSKADDIVLGGKKKQKTFSNTPALTGNISRLRTLMEDVRQGIQSESEESATIGEIIACSSTKWVDGHRMGINELRFAMLRAAGLEYRPPSPAAKKPLDLVSHEELVGRIPHFP